MRPAHRMQFQDVGVEGYSSLRQAVSFLLWSSDLLCLALRKEVYVPRILRTVCSPEHGVTCLQAIFLWQIINFHGRAPAPISLDILYTFPFFVLLHFVEHEGEHSCLLSSYCAGGLDSAADYIQGKVKKND